MRLVLLLLACAGTANARTITAGPGQEYSAPSAAAAAAADGDTIQIAPGAYFDCIVTTKSLTIQGPATLTDTTCEGKAILVLKGDSAVVRDLTLARARVPDGNGAGIRWEGRNLTAERVRFENNEVALLAGAGGALTVTGCDITAGPAGLIAVLVGDAEQVIISDTRLTVTHGSVLSSSAKLTTITGSTIETADGGVMLSGTAAIQDAVFTLRSGAASQAVRTTGGGVSVRRVRLVNATGQPAALLQDWGRERPAVEANLLQPGDTEVSTAGVWRFRAGRALRDAKATLKDAARGAKRAVLGP